MNDQNGTKHAYEFDGIGRLTDDKVTALGSGIDSTIRRLVYLYDQRGFLLKASSYAATSGGSPLNQCWFIYDD